MSSYRGNVFCILCFRFCFEKQKFGIPPSRFAPWKRREKRSERARNSWIFELFSYLCFASIAEKIVTKLVNKSKSNNKTLSTDCKLFDPDSNSKMIRSQVMLSNACARTFYERIFLLYRLALLIVAFRCLRSHSRRLLLLKKKRAKVTSSRPSHFAIQISNPIDIFFPSSPWIRSVVPNAFLCDLKVSFVYLKWQNLAFGTPGWRWFGDFARKLELLARLNHPALFLSHIFRPIGIF